MNIQPEEISTLNKLLYVVCAFAALVAYLDITIWRP